MNCQDLRRALAHLEEPQRPPAAIRSHLAGCSPCRAWHRQLTRIERAVPLLPVPASNGKARFVERVLAGQVPVAPPDRTPSRPINTRQKLALATALAAGLVLFAASFSALQLRRTPPTEVISKPATPSYPHAEKIMESVARLPRTATPRERMESLAAAADNVHRLSHDLARRSDGDGLRALAGWYEAVLQPQLVSQARVLPVNERALVLGTVASQLDRIIGETTDVALQMPESTGKALLRIAGISEATARNLRNI
jgi:hypothetical protein